MDTIPWISLCFYMARAVVVLYWATWPVRVAANPQAYDVWRGIWMERSKQMIERSIRDLLWRWGLVKEPTNARDEWTYENERGEYIQPPVPPEQGNNKISSINPTSSILHPETDSRGNTGCFYSLVIRSLNDFSVVNTVPLHDLPTIRVSYARSSKKLTQSVQAGSG